MSTDPLDVKLNDVFVGKVVRKDLLLQVKKGTNVPSFVLEFLLARYCASDDPREIQEGMGARARQAAKRGQGVEGLSDEAEEVAAPAPGVDIVALHEALAELATIDPRASQVVELRFFGGFSVEETAETLGVSVRTVINDWNTARAWLHHELEKRHRP